MSDSYQAIYDAVRSRIQGANVESAVREAMDFSWQKERMVECFREATVEMQLPSVLYRADIRQETDGRWSCCYSGVVAFGRSPAEAASHFNYYAWLGQPTPEQTS
jgi:hypothetical protein